MEDISIRKLSLVRMLEVAITLVPLFVYIHYGFESASARIDATIAAGNAANAASNAANAATNARLDATWERLIAITERQQQSNGGK